MKTVDGVTGDWNSYYSGGSNCATYLTNDVTPITDWKPKGSCDSTCTQVTSGVCSSEFLANALKGFGVKYAFCNDEWLHIIASGETGGMYTENLNDTPYPPAAGSDFSKRTGMDTLDTSRTQGETGERWGKALLRARTLARKDTRSQGHSLARTLARKDTRSTHKPIYPTPH